MKKLSILKNQQGFTLVQAIFILVVLALLGTAMMRLSGIQSSTSVFALQGARAYQAARSGIEWGARRARDGECAPSTTFPLVGLEGFNVEVVCTLSLPINEGSLSYHVYTLTSRASSIGTYRSVDFVSRQVEARVTGL
jgi:MSHA biogenesis protein MshP